MISFICLGILLSFPHFLEAELSEPNKKITFIILSQNNSYNKKLSQERKNEILRQTKGVTVSIRSTHSIDFDVQGYWTIFPIIKRLMLENDRPTWFFFCEDVTHVNVRNLLNVISQKSAEDSGFIGHALKDEEPTIIHHFDSTDKDSGILYPHFSSGFLLSFALAKRIASRIHLIKKSDFAIDSKYEFAKVLFKEGVKLYHEPRLCLQKNSTFCATWIEDDVLYCGATSERQIHVAVKTCEKFHKNRILNVVKKTWSNDIENLSFFSDVEDASIPTIKLGVKNVASGHCEKTLSIMRYYVEKSVSAEWLVIVDDDTLISFKRLRGALSCYNSSENIALGERYGYDVASESGYDYITGGGGMVFSWPTLLQIVKACQCPALDSPDDMILGICLKMLNIPIIHSPLFHQARSIDYSPEFLRPYKHISFHKHYMIKPSDVYKEWLQDSNSDEPHNHSEL